MLHLFGGPELEVVRRLTLELDDEVGHESLKKVGLSVRVCGDSINFLSVLKQWVQELHGC
jgi:hypothetical protein